MLEHIEVYRIYYNHRCGTGSSLIAVRSINELEQACNEFEKRFEELGYDIQDIAPSVEMTPTLFTKPITQFDCKHLHEMFQDKDDLCPYCSQPWNKDF